MEEITAPFTEEQVKNLNDFQKSGRFHPFTCCSDEKSPSCKRRASGDARWKKYFEYKSKGIDWLKQQIKELNDPDYDPEKLADIQMANVLAARDIPYTDENDGVLVATTEGWVCPCGEYKQNWAHAFMAEPQK